MNILHGTFFHKFLPVLIKNSKDRSECRRPKLTDPDASGSGPQFRIRTKMSRIPNTGSKVILLKYINKSLSPSALRRWVRYRAWQPSAPFPSAISWHAPRHRCNPKAKATFRSIRNICSNKNYRGPVQYILQVSYHKRIKYVPYLQWL